MYAGRSSNASLEKFSDTACICLIVFPDKYTQTSRDPRQSAWLPTLRTIHRFQFLELPIILFHHASQRERVHWQRLLPYPMHTGVLYKETFPCQPTGVYIWLPFLTFICRPPAFLLQHPVCRNMWPSLPMYQIVS
jgi:hypothetical protein